MLLHLLANILTGDETNKNDPQISMTKWRQAPALISFIALRTDGSGMISTIKICSMLYPYAPITWSAVLDRMKEMMVSARS